MRMVEKRIREWDEQSKEYPLASVEDFNAFSKEELGDIKYETRNDSIWFHGEYPNDYLHIFFNNGMTGIEMHNGFSGCNVNFAKTTIALDYGAGIVVYDNSGNHNSVTYELN